MNRFELTTMFNIENWSQGLRELSFKTVGIRLEMDEVDAILANLGEFGDEESDKEGRNKVLNVARALGSQMYKAKISEGFLKLGSRSDKDNYPMWRRNTPRIHEHEAQLEIFTRLTGTSERFYEDLSAARANGYRPWLFIREFAEIPKWQEFRCFVHDGELRQISQYFYREYFPEIAEHVSYIPDLVADYLEKKLKPAARVKDLQGNEIELKDYVFDIAIEVNRLYELNNDYDITLIELNPPLYEAFGVDPCLFTHEEIKSGIREFRYNKFTPASVAIGGSV